VIRSELHLEPRIARMPLLEEGGTPLGLVDELDERQL